MLACLRTYMWALSSGILLAWTFPNFHWYPLAWLALVPLLINTASLTARESATRFFVGGWVFHSIVLQWLIGNVFWAGGWAILGQQGVCLALSCYWAVLGVLWVRIQGRVPVWARALVFALCWVAMEWLQARLFTGFGWTSLGYSQGPDAWFSQWAALGGVILLSGILVGCSAFIAQAWTEQRLRWKLLGAALLVVAGAHGLGYLLYGSPVVQEGAPFNVGLYQSNYPQEMKWDPEFSDIMLEKAIHQSTVVLKNAPVDLFVWPEGLIMSDYRTPRFLAAMEQFVEDTDVPLFTGTGRRDDLTGDGYNSSVLLTPGEEIGVYDKVKLAPFGEYIPFESWLSFAASMGAGGGTTAGDTGQVFSVGDRKFGPLICFEVLFSPLADERRRMGADFLVVVTNLGWFGRSNVLPQKFEIARFRAIENRLPLVQCANTGISGVIDPWGRISIIDGAVLPNDRYVKLKGGTTDRQRAMVTRRAAAIPVPEAASLPLPGSVPWFGRIMTLLGVVVALWLVVPQAKFAQVTTS